LDQPASFEATLPGDLERDFGVPPEGEQFLLALEEILEAPTAVTGRGEEQIQPVSVKELEGPIGRLALRIAVSVSFNGVEFQKRPFGVETCGIATPRGGRLPRYVSPKPGGTV
jgi:hypothetical protein